MDVEIVLIDDFVNLQIIEQIIQDLSLFIGYGFIAMTVLILLSFGIFKAFSFFQSL